MVPNGYLCLPQMGFCLGLISAVQGVHRWSIIKEEHSERGDFRNIREHWGIYLNIAIDPKNALFYHKQP